MHGFTRPCYSAAAGWLIALCLAVSACAQAPSAAAPAAGGGPGAPDSGLPLIDRLIGNAACSGHAECRVIGVGALACGGPEAYRAWSVTGTDAGALETAVRRDAAARKAALDRAGLRSTCAVRPVPGVACRRATEAEPVGRCVLLPASAAGVSPHPAVAG
jgi:hypothetical protein